MAHRALQSTGSFPFPASYMSMGDGNTTPLEFVCGMDEYGVHQAIGVTSMPRALTLPITPPEPTTQHSQHEGHSLDPYLVDTVLQHDCITKNVRRRMQNREAQRRFRERKDQQQKTLQQKAEDLQMKCQSLLDQYTKRTDEVCRLLKENDALRSEVKTLRQQWEVISTILQRPKGSRSSSVLVDETSPSPSLCSSSERSRKLDDFWRRLDDFTNDREDPSRPS
ncbi:hypothetical protein CNMCM5793_006741 [Aspergillus hiratsukae]|uniref:BZIP domain-containing protein n=1 Tax=Aspergillus hiratsukae TaxID=1194566 RepID=A0A8H6QJE5_9EURO|nr:hypothetical protein CNMCM5793_006741 [Aspergillus hiratsukae]KAF7173599.1 hypothetical protein CNMCM6106_007678 [Aspergillus hiratsukae]